MQPPAGIDTGDLPFVEVGQLEQRVLLGTQPAGGLGRPLWVAVDPRLQGRLILADFVQANRLQPPFAIQLFQLLLGLLEPLQAIFAAGAAQAVFKPALPTLAAILHSSQSLAQGSDALLLSEAGQAASFHLLFQRRGTIERFV